MPIYAYRCESCGHEKDVIQKFSDAPLTTCPACGADALRKQLTAPAFQLKGSGWYVTDFRDGNKGKAAKPADEGVDATKADAAKPDGSASDAAKAGAAKTDGPKSDGPASDAAKGGAKPEPAKESSSAAKPAESGTKSQPST